MPGVRSRATLVASALVGLPLLALAAPASADPAPAACDTQTWAWPGTAGDQGWPYAQIVVTGDLTRVSWSGIAPYTVTQVDYVDTSNGGGSIVGHDPGAAVASLDATLTSINVVAEACGNPTTEPPTTTDPPPPPTTEPPPPTTQEPPPTTEHPAPHPSTHSAPPPTTHPAPQPGTSAPSTARGAPTPRVLTSGLDGSSTPTASDSPQPSGEATSTPGLERTPAAAPTPITSVLGQTFTPPTAGSSSSSAGRLLAVNPPAHPGGGTPVGFTVLAGTVGALLGLLLIPKIRRTASGDPSGRHRGTPALVDGPPLGDVGSGGVLDDDPDDGPVPGLG